MIEVQTQHEWNTLLRTTLLRNETLTIRIDEHDNTAPTVCAVPDMPRERVKPLVTPSWVTDFDQAVEYWMQVMEGNDPKAPNHYGILGQHLNVPNATTRARRRLTQEDFPSAA